jgi:DNA-directed RNA polymerase specialized sigma24 family protein
MLRKFWNTDGAMCSACLTSPRLSLSAVVIELSRSMATPKSSRFSATKLRRSLSAPSSPWIVFFGLARNVFLMNRRAARRWAKLHDSCEDLPEFPVLPEADRLGSQDEIRRCIADLAPEQSEALLLHHEWGFSFEEIAGMLGISAAAARARASRGMADLRLALNSLQRARA